MNTIAIKIDVTKIQKERLYKGKKGTYLDAILVHKPNEYGDDYFIAQSVSKEHREQGERGPIIGNARILKRREEPEKPKPAQSEDAAGDDVPF